MSAIGSVVTVAERGDERHQHIAGLAYVVLAAQFMTAIMLAASMAPGYDIVGGAISDLGVVPETAWLFNASLLAVGLLNLAGAALVFRTRRSLVALAIAVAASAGALGAGLIPLDRGDVHGLFALAAFLCFNLQAVSDALWSRSLVRLVGLVLGAVGLVFVGVMMIGDSGNPAAFGPIGHGAAERMIVYPPMFWLMVHGGYLMGRPPAGRSR